MNHDIKLLVTASLNKGKSIGLINTEIKQLQKVINKQRLNLKVNIDNSALKQIEQFNKRMKRLGDQTANTKKMIEETFSTDGSRVKRTFFDDKSIKENTSAARSLNSELAKSATYDRERERALQYEHRVRDALSKQEQQNREKALQYEQRTRNAIEQNRQREISQRERVLQYEQRVRNSVEKNVQKEKQKTIELQRQLSLYQRQAKLNVQNIRRTHGTTVDSTDLRNYLSQVNALTTSTPNLDARMKDLSMRFREVSGNARDAAGSLSQSGMAVSEMMRTALIKFPIWILNCPE